MTTLRRLMLASAVLAFFALPTGLSAIETMPVTGTIFSITQDEYVIRSENSLIHVRKSLLSEGVRAKLDAAHAHEITVEVPMNAIQRIRDPHEKPAPASVEDGEINATEE